MDKNENKNERTIEYLEDSSALVGRRRRELVDKDTGEILQVEQTTRLLYPEFPPNYNYDGGLKPSIVYKYFCSSVISLMRILCPGRW